MAVMTGSCSNSQIYWKFSQVYLPTKFLYNVDFVNYILLIISKYFMVGFADVAPKIFLDMHII